MALEKLMPCLPLFVRTSQLMNSSIRLNFANTAIVCLQSDDALNPGQSEQSVLPLGKIFTIWGFRGSDEDATTNVSLDWFVIASVDHGRNKCSRNPVDGTTKNFLCE
jgi:hypothetical protein